MSTARHGSRSLASLRSPRAQSRHITNFFIMDHPHRCRIVTSLSTLYPFQKRQIMASLQYANSIVKITVMTIIHDSFPMRKTVLSICEKFRNYIKPLISSISCAEAAVRLIFNVSNTSTPRDMYKKWINFGLTKWNVCGELMFSSVYTSYANSMKTINTDRFFTWAAISLQ